MQETIRVSVLRVWLPAVPCPVISEPACKQIYLPSIQKFDEAGR